MTESIDNKVVKNPEVVEKAARRRFTAGYKQRIVTEIQQCSQPSEIGALLRREGLHSPTVQRWRNQLQEPALSSSKKSTQKESPAKEIARLKRENDRLAEKLRLAERVSEQCIEFSMTTKASASDATS